MHAFGLERVGYDGRAEASHEHYQHLALCDQHQHLGKGHVQHSTRRPPLIKITTQTRGTMASGWIDDLSRVPASAIQPAFHLRKIICLAYIRKGGFIIPSRVAQQGGFMPRPNGVTR